MTLSPTGAIRPSDTPDRRRVIGSFAAIAALGMLVRFLYLSQSRAAALSGLLVVDARQYDLWSDRIAGGDWLGDTVFYQAPLYPYFLAVLKVLLGIGPEDGLQPIRAAQAVLGGLACGVLFLAGRAMFSFRVGVAAGVMLALYAPAVFFDSTIQKTGLGTLWTVLLLWAIGAGMRRPRWGVFAAAGACLGALMLTREETILLVPVLAAWTLARRGVAMKRRAAWLGALAAGLAIVLLPVGIRNHAVGGEFVLTTSQAGPNFYIGNNPGANGMYAPLRPGRSNTPLERKDAFELAEQALGRSLTPKEVDRYWRARAMEFITGRPGAWLRLMGRKAALLANAHEIPDAEDQYYFERYSGLLNALAGVWHFGVLLPLAAAGVALTARRRRELWVLYAVVLTISAAVVLFFVFGRYRFPLVPPLMLLAGAGLVEIVALIRTRPLPARRLALAGAAALPAAALANWPLLRPEDLLATSYANAGAALAEAGRTEPALEHYREALRLNPDMAEVRANLALLHGRAGRMADALSELKLALLQQPDNARLHFSIGTVYAETGQLEAAARHLEEAARLGPSDVDTRANLAQVRFALGRVREGVAALREVARLAPDHLPTTVGLARLFAAAADDALRDGPEAVRLAERATAQTQRADPEILDVLAMAYAETGRFTDAIATAREAATLARKVGRAELAAAIEGRIAGYEQGRAHRE